MIPAPRTAAWLTGCAPFSYFLEVFFTTWSLMNKPINAPACGVTAALAKPSASALRASLRGKLAPACKESSINFGAGYCAGFAFASTAPFAVLNAIICSSGFNLTGSNFS